MKRLINKRKQYKSLSRGDMKFLHCENPKILAFTRSYQDETMLVIVNLSRYTQPAELDLDDRNLIRRRRKPDHQATDELDDRKGRTLQQLRWQTARDRNAPRTRPPGVDEQGRHTGHGRRRLRLLRCR